MCYMRYVITVIVFKVKKIEYQKIRSWKEDREVSRNIAQIDLRDADME